MDITAQPEASTQQLPSSSFRASVREIKNGRIQVESEEGLMYEAEIDPNLLSQIAGATNVVIRIELVEGDLKVTKVKPRRV